MKRVRAVRTRSASGVASSSLKQRGALHSAATCTAAPPVQLRAAVL
jgi:hypothetical protein